MRRISIALAILGLAAAAPLLARGDDKEIARKIIAKLKEQQAAGRLEGSDIDLKVEQGVVYVRGRVASREQETMVLETARLTPGVTQVLRNIQVATVPDSAPPAPMPPAAPETKAMQPAQVAQQQPDSKHSSRRNPADDAAIQMIVGPSTPRAVNLAEESVGVLHASSTQALGQSPGTPAAEHPVQLVQQSSEPPSALQIYTEPVSAKGEQPSHIAQVSNIVPVSSGRSVAQTTTALHHESTSAGASKGKSADATDMAIARQIINRLKQEREVGNLEGMDLDLKVENRVVWFRGAVASAEQEKIVLNAARITPGVAKVMKDITIRSSTSVANAGDGSHTVQAAASQPAAPAAGLQSVGQTAPQLAPVNPYYAYPYAGYYPAQNQSPVPFAPAQPASAELADAAGATGAAPGMAPYCPTPLHAVGAFGGAGVRYDHPHLPAYAWPTYAAYPNYAAVTYPKQYSPTVWPYIGPFYPYPQVPLGWRKVTLEWDDGWWQLDFKDQSRPWKMR